MEGKKKPSEKENNAIIQMMLGKIDDAPAVPEPQKTRLSKEAEKKCIATVNATVVIPHPTADDQPKCVACKTTVTLHMVVLVDITPGKKYSLDFCNPCMLVAEADGTTFVEDAAACGCPMQRFRMCLDCRDCYMKKRAEDELSCNVCGELPGGEKLLGMAHEYLLKEECCGDCRKTKNAKRYPDKLKCMKAKKAEEREKAATMSNII